MALAQGSPGHWSLVIGHRPDHTARPLVTFWRGEIALAHMVSDQSPYDYDHWTDEKHDHSNIKDEHFIHWIFLFELVIGHWTAGPLGHWSLDRLCI